MTKTLVSPDGTSTMPVDSPAVEVRMKARGWTEQPIPAAKQAPRKASTPAVKTEK